MTRSHIALREPLLNRRAKVANQSSSPLQYIYVLERVKDYTIQMLNICVANNIRLYYNRA